MKVVSLAHESLCKQDQLVLLLVHKLKTLSKFVNTCIMSLRQMNIKTFEGYSVVSWYVKRL
ncbi:hypothetical protein Hanom_Chr14g01309031 [Helianthus anomalus]